MQPFERSGNQILRSTNRVRRELRDGRWVYVKQYQVDNWDATAEVIADRIELELRTLNRIDEQRDWHRRLGKMEIVEADADSGTIVTVEVPGATVSHWISSYRPSQYRTLLNIFYQSGRWIRTFQKLEVTEADLRPIGEKNPIDPCDYLQIRINELVQRGYRGISASQWDTVLDTVRFLNTQFDANDRTLVMCHHDYSPGNIVTDGYHVTPIDYQMTAPGSPLLDVAYFLHRVEMTRLYRPWLRRPWKQWRNAFIAGYGRADLTETPLYKSLLIRLYVLRLLTYARPKNPSIKETLHCKWLMAAIRHKLLRELKS